MPNILIRDLSEEAIERIDAKATHLGLSRNEYLRRQLEAESASESERPLLTRADLVRAAEAARDLNDPEIMAGAWR